MPAPAGVIQAVLVTTDADGERDALAADQYQERRRARPGDRQWKIQLGLGLLWVGLAVNFWLDGDSDPTLRWLWTGVAALQLGTAFLLRRRVQNQPSS